MWDELVKAAKPPTEPITPAPHGPEAPPAEPVAGLVAGLRSCHGAGSFAF